MSRLALFALAGCSIAATGSTTGAFSTATSSSSSSSSSSGCALCASGLCVPSCPSGQLACDGGGASLCIDPRSDSQNCGGCGAACAVGELCFQGACTAAPTCGLRSYFDCAPRFLSDGGADCTACAPAFTACGPTCFDLRTSLYSCGSCGHGCPPGQYCDDGGCTAQCPDASVCAAEVPGLPIGAPGYCVPECPSGFTACGGGNGATATCVDTGSDPQHCGGCNMACPAGDTCFRGACAPTCGPRRAELYCPGMPQSDGGIDCSRCPDGGNGCTQCTDAGFTLACDGVCVDPRSDLDNCGACNVACKADQRCETGACVPQCDAETVCLDIGVCAGGCPSGTTACGGAGQCVDLQSDASNCGSCDAGCTNQEACFEGRCVPFCHDL